MTLIPAEYVCAGQCFVKFVFVLQFVVVAVTMFWKKLAGECCSNNRTSAKKK